MRLAGGATIATGAAAMLAAAPLMAQSINDFRLPGATATTAPSGTQGPVDPDHPVVQERIVKPAPTPAAAAPTPDAGATPVAAAPAPTAKHSPAPAPGRAATTAGKPAAKPALQAAPTGAPAALPGPAASATASTSTPGPLPAPQAALPVASVPATSAASPANLWPWIAAALGLLALVFAGLWWRSRRTNTVVVEFEAPVPAKAPAEPATAPPPETVRSAPDAPAERIPVPSPIVGTVPQGLAITLEARRMTASLMATTLSYALTLTNTGEEPLSTLAVEGDMISAHASIPPDQQIAQGDHRLELRHALVSLQPGESAEFSGDFRLPLAAVTPIRAGDAAFFVPLARLRVEASTEAGRPLVMVETFVVGELGDNTDAGLRPFRLDLGPRTYTRLGQRAVT